MSLQNPPVFEHGFVVGRYVTAIADTLGDDDRYPDLRPITGRVRFTPLQTVHLKGGEYPATVVKQPITVHLDGGGYLVDVESRDDPNRPAGVYLAVGLYRVEPVFENVSSISRFTIQVTADHTKEAPLDLTLAAPIETPPGFTEVVRIVDRVRAEDAADQAESHAATALVYRDEAASSATTAQTHSATAVESAEAAEGHADRAETARDQTINNAIEVDTSVGTRVMVAGQMVHGEIGWRIIARWNANGEVTSGAIPDGFAPTGTRAGGIYLRRDNNTVTLSMVDVQAATANPTITSTPQGFRGNTSSPYPTIPLVYLDDQDNYNAAAMEVGGTVYRFRVPSGARLAAIGGGGYGVMMSWVTAESWPRNLPGTPL